MLLQYKLYNYIPLGGLIVIGGLLIIVGLGPVIIPSDGIPCADRHVMCAPEPNHAADRPSSDEEPLSPSKSFVETRTISAATATTLEDQLVRMPQ